MKYTHNPFEVFPGLKNSSLLTLQVALAVTEERFTKIDAEYGLTINELWVLMAAAERQVRQGLLGECIGIGKNAMVLLAKRMEARKLIKRVRNSKNLRQVFLYLTPKGADLLAKVIKELPITRRRAFHPVPLKALEEEVLPLAMAQIENYFKEKGSE